MPEQKPHHKNSFKLIRTVYLYLVSMIGLIVFIMGSVGTINTVFSNYVFQVNDYYYIDPLMGGKGGFCAQRRMDPSDPTGTKMYVPTETQIAECQKLEKEQNDRNRNNMIGREISIAIAQLAVGLPVWLFHWGIIQKEYRRKEERE